MPAGHASLSCALLVLLFTPRVAPAGAIADRYEDVARRIHDTVMEGNGAWKKAEELCDGIGHRLSGSPQLDRALHWAANAMKADGHENVRIEPVMVPHWVRGRESAEMVAPRHAKLTMLGLGGSVGTPPEGITAEVEVVHDEEELDALGAGARGKIVLFNNAMPPYDPEAGAHYGHTVRFRSNGPQLASAHGAVAVLVRSVTAHSLNTPHTGATRYGDAAVRIPAASVTVEAATLIARLRARGETVRVNLKMEARTLPDAPSGNVIGELRGSTHPEEIVVIGGHIDAWDVGTGAHDDGCPCIFAMEAITVLRKMNLRPRRTIRVVLWTNEENGLRGGRAYADDHADELANHVAAIEADSGAFEPRGYSIDCQDEDRMLVAAEQMRDLTQLFESIGATDVRTGFSGVDLGPMKPAGVVLMGHRVEGSTYFDYHHTPADTLDKVDPDALSRNVAVMATTAYVLADMPGRLGDR